MEGRLGWGDMGERPLQDQPIPFQESFLPLWASVFFPHKMGRRSAGLDFCTWMEVSLYFPWNSGLRLQ